jgi:catalase
MPFNANKPLEHGHLALQPQPGQSVQPANPSATGSTLTETNESDKVGGGDPRVGMNPVSGPLDRVRGLFHY